MVEPYIKPGGLGKLQQENHDLLYEVGFALTTWMAVECQAQQTFAIAMRVWDDSSSRAVFRSAINANARLAMTNEAVTHALKGQDDLLGRWNKIYARAKKLAQRRNHLAHGQVASLEGPTKANGERVIVIRLIDPLDPNFNRLPFNRRAVESTSLSQVKELRASFVELSGEMYEHGQETYTLLRQLRESREQ